MEKSCFNCKRRTWGEGMWMEQCMDFEMCDDEKEMAEKRLRLGRASLSYVALKLNLPQS